MWDLILEYGMPTVSWYAEFAFRRRVSMSAIGSVIVMANRPSSPRFPSGFHRRRDLRCARSSWLPTGLGDAGQLTAMRHHAEADSAQAKPAVDGTRPPAANAPRVAAHLELGRPVCLDNQRLLRHCQPSLKGKPSRRSSERPSASFVAVVTTVMSIPRCLSTLSGSISWNMTCSVRPNV